MAKKKVAAKSTEKKAPTKSEIYASLAETTGLTRKQIGEVFDAFSALIGENLSKKGAGQFTVPGLMKIVAIDKKAQKPREVRNPKTGEMMMSKPKPAMRVVKVRPLKNLKDMA